MVKSSKYRCDSDEWIYMGKLDSMNYDNTTLSDESNDSDNGMCSEDVESECKWSDSTNSNVNKYKYIEEW